ncbi:uncharacterized protein LOC143032274 [Oratosquilla oratoria]|uniref:uncharacterized protein LOC143032274 n=1 Tax=Oratosquilla oratoria TaxID=337810 RepID=UPI003F75A250
MEIQSRMNLASTAFGRLRNRLFSNYRFRIDTKAAEYRAVVISTPLYGSEAWILYNRENCILENFNIRCLLKILGVSRKDKISYDELYTNIETTMAQWYLRWLGHTIKMPEHWLSRLILYGQPTEGIRSLGGPKMRYKGYAKHLLKKCDIQPQELEALAVDGWTT